MLKIIAKIKEHLFLRIMLQHLMSTPQKLCFQKLIVLFICKKNKKLQVIESLEILRVKQEK